VGRILLIDPRPCNPFTEIFFKFYTGPTIGD